MKSFPSIEEFSAAANAAIESGDPADRDKFTEATGMLPYAFQAQLQTLGQDQLLRAVKAHVDMAAQRQQEAHAIPVRYEAKPLQAHQSTHPFGVFDQVSGERVFAGKQSECGRLAGLMQSAFETGIGHAQAGLAPSPQPGRAARNWQSLGELLKAQKAADASEPIEAARRRAGEKSEKDLEDFNKVEAFISYCKDELTRQITSGISADRVKIRFGMFEGSQSADPATTSFALTDHLANEHGPTKSVEPLWADMQQWAKDAGLSVSLVRNCYSGDRYSWTEMHATPVPEPELAKAGRAARREEAPSLGR